MLAVISLFGYLNRWNDSMGTSLEEGAVESGKQYLGNHGWNRGKHVEIYSYGGCFKKLRTFSFLIF